MLVLPVVGRELLIQARQKSTYWIRVVASAIAGLLMLWVLLVGAAVVPMASQGKMLFSTLSGLAFIYCLFIGPLVTADCLSAEKRQGTLGLLFLTDLKGYDVILGKLVSSSAHCAYGLLAVVPMISLALLLGGVTAGEIGRTALVLGNTLFFSLSAGMFVSTLSENDRKAVFMAILLILIVALGPYEVEYILASQSALGSIFDVAGTVLSPSPVFAFMLAQSAKGAVQPWALYSSLGQTHALAWLLLGLSCAILPRVCRDRPQGRRRERWGAWSRHWRLGSEGERTAFRRQLLERNPCFWLSSRERHKSALVWVLIGALSAIGFWIYFNEELVFYEAALFLLFTIHVLLKVWFTGETCHRWIEDRQCGALELLLCVPLRIRDLVRGQGMALWRQFGWPVLVTLGLTLAAWAIIVRQSGHDSTTRFGRTWLLISMPALIADLAALRWVGAWLGLRARGLNRAMGGTMARVLWLRWIVYLLCIGTVSAWKWINLGQVRLVPKEPLWLVLALTFDLILSWSARRRFLNHFRTIAANPADYRSATRTIPVAAEQPLNQVQRADGSKIESARRKQKIRRIAWGVAVSLLVFGIPLGYRYWLKREVSNRIQAIQQAGFPVTSAELDRQRPPLTNGVNAAEVLERAAPGLVRWYQLPAHIRPDLRDFQTAFPFPTKPVSIAVRDAIRSYLSSNVTSLAIIHEVSSLRQGRYARDWNSSGGKYTVQFQAMPQVTSLLQYEVVLRADDRDVAGALDSLHRLLDLGRSLDREVGPRFFGMRKTCFATAFNAMESLLSRCSVSEPDLQALQKELIEAEAAMDLQLALVGLRCFAVDCFQSPSPADFTGMGTPRIAMEQIRIGLQNWIYDLTGAKDRDFIRYLDAMDEFTQIVSAPLPERFFRARSLGTGNERAYPSGYTGSIPYLKTVLNSLNPFYALISPNAEFVARCRTAQTALAIEQYRLRHTGQLPETLDPLVPDIIRKLPLDPFAGQPIRYKRLEKGYCVYSVGKNGRDDVEAQVLPPPPGRSAGGDDITFSVDR